MSKTPVSELNARMSLDISPLEQAVPRASALLKRLSAVQAEAFAAQSGGPDVQAMSQRMRAAAKSPGVLGVEGGGRVRFQNREDELKFVDDLAAAHEESLRRRAAREAAMRAEQKNAAQEYLAEVKMVDDAMAAASDAQAKRLQEQLAYEEMLTDRRAASARAQIEFADMQRDAVAKSARESFAVFDSEARKAEERLATEQKIADIRRKQAQIRATSEFDRANPFEQQVLASKELNRLLAVRRGLQRGTVEFAEAELAVTRQIATVRNIRDQLTVGTAAMRNLGTTAADSQKGAARFGLAMQQAGYQVQDFAVQVTSGTNGMVAFSQQASQLLGFFGGFKGAIAGAALSAAILVYRLYDTAKGAEAAKKAQDEYNTVLKEYVSLSRERATLRDPEAKRGFTEQDAKAAIAEFEKQKSAIADIEQKLVDARRELVSPSGGFGQTPEEEAARIAVANSVIDALKKKSDAARDALFGIAKAASQARLELEKLVMERAKAMADKNWSDTQERAKAASSELLAIDRERNQLVNRNLTVFQKIAKAEEAIAAFGDPGSNPEAIAQQKRLVLERDKLVAQAQDVAQGYRDSLDPLSEQKKKIEEINRLKGLGLLEDHEAALLQARIADERERQLKLPDAMRAQTGSSVAGLRNTDGTANQLVTLQQQMLAELRKLVWQGSN